MSASARSIAWFLSWLVALLLLPRSARPADDDDVADVPSGDLRAAADNNRRYFLIGSKPDADSSKVPCPLLLVLPGGDGSASYHPFVKRIYKNALKPDYLVAQLVAPKWNPQQEIVWPTRKVQVNGQKFTTEEFAQAVVEEIKVRHKLDDRRIFLLAWSSSGPAAYAISLQENCPVRGSFIAMSIYKPEVLPPLSRAKDQAYFLLHSPQDTICLYGIAQAAARQLADHGASTKLVDYPGGHGWRGNLYANIRQGIEWLEENAKRPAPTTRKAGE